MTQAYKIYWQNINTSSSEKLDIIRFCFSFWKIKQNIVKTLQANQPPVIPVTVVRSRTCILVQHRYIIKCSSTEGKKKNHSSLLLQFASLNFPLFLWHQSPFIIMAVTKKACRPMYLIVPLPTPTLRKSAQRDISQNDLGRLSCLKQRTSCLI